jgi:hypothetical protein
VGVSEVVVDQLEFAEVGDDRSRCAEAFEGAPVVAMVEDRPVALDELLVASLALADVVE